MHNIDHVNISVKNNQEWELWNTHDITKNIEESTRELSRNFTDFDEDAILGIWNLLCNFKDKADKWVLIRNWLLANPDVPETYSDAVSVTEEEFNKKLDWIKNSINSLFDSYEWNISELAKDMGEILNTDSFISSLEEKEDKWGFLRSWLNLINWDFLQRPENDSEKPKSRKPTTNRDLKTEIAWNNDSNQAKNPYNPYFNPANHSDWKIKQALKNAQIWNI